MNIAFLVWLTFTLLFGGMIGLELKSFNGLKPFMSKVASVVMMVVLSFAFIFMTIAVYSDTSNFESLWWWLFIVAGFITSVRLYFELIIGSRADDWFEDIVDRLYGWYEDRQEKKEMSRSQDC